MRKPVLLGIVFLAIVLAVIIYSSMNMSANRVEVCMVFNGRETCKIASGPTEQNTLQTAITNACGEIASGVTDTISCQSTTPKSITWLKRQ